MKKKGWDLNKVIQEAEKRDLAGAPDAGQATRIAGLQVGHWPAKHIALEADKLEHTGKLTQAHGLRLAAAEVPGSYNERLIRDIGRVNEKLKTAGTVAKAMPTDPKWQKTISRSVSAVDPKTGKTVKVQEKLKRKKKAAAGEVTPPAGPAVPPPVVASIAPKPGLYQIVGRVTGKTIAEAATPAEAQAISTKLGPGVFVIPPEGVPMAGSRFAQATARGP
ncbi:MAG: hypothetical protein Q8P59_04175, partial [Dehalococcoidia bacterium]|nr:hypothetical protein [Dehalococcoidia bacterium]